ncbi:MAG TPA: hypothetical protein VIJ28_08025 [Chloroflexota bacterium]|jgi:hypothetical protein
MRQVVGGTFSRRAAQVPLAVFSLLVATALVVMEFVDGNAVGGPIGFVIAALFVLNGVVRIALWQVGGGGSGS